MITIRKAVKADASALGALYVRVWRETYPSLVASDILMAMCPARAAERWAASITAPDSRNHILVAEDDTHGVVALASFGPNLDGDLGADGEIYALYVDTDHEGRGIGRALMAHAAYQMLNNGMTSCLTWHMTYSQNRFFCEAMGARAAARKPGKVGPMPVALTAYVWENLEANFEDWQAASAWAFPAETSNGSSDLDL